MSDDYKVLACLPTDRDLILRIAKEIGMDPEQIPRPTDLYTLANCERCECSVWVGPRQMEAKRADTAIRTFCYMCAAKHSTAMESLGGGHTVEGRSRW